ncbi:putative hydro-lyase [Cognatishimia sp. F0-27]|uniref:putative hydro-lyase n=1 Tax=Cognatishimia sp. F0-27 TaxID=2816855 RepID=UPI001D0C2F39|nr:putative hydro-lyase [Cognatishimia sp. F0-27]MCC1491508.1 putative hydro-lyase [Cognatishimia sp. F0-27]
MTMDFAAMRKLSAPDARKAIREGAYARHTAGLAAGCLQANIVILPESYALDFMRFCQRNPKPCPLVGVTETGDPVFRTMGQDVDVRSDIPAYNIYRDGHRSETVADITDHWRDDMVGFALGCSFTFEKALQSNGIPVWHIDNDSTVPMFQTTIPLTPAGPFGGHMVVSMRAVPEADVARVAEISARYPLAHGAPVHSGDPQAIGIRDISQPEWGDPAPVPSGHVPVFWACGVTPQSAVMRAKLPLAITHAPGHMLISDVPEEAEVPILTPVD